MQTRGGVWGLQEFNDSILACLPKTPVEVDDDGPEIFEAQGTRPLAIVNTDNRIMRNAARMR